jgi:hypothetical protein
MDCRWMPRQNGLAKIATVCSAVLPAAKTTSGNPVRRLR